MEIGTQIKALRQARGITQEILSEALGVSPQAVSKWERGEAIPDVALLPELSTYFGVTIDELFSLTDEARMERIQNMLWDERTLSPEVAARESAFLQELARRKPESGKPLELLAELENHLARTHRERAAEYAKESLRREPEQKGAHSELFETLRGAWPTEDWYAGSHSAIIDWYKDFVAKNPGYRSGYLWLMDLLITDGRLEEAAQYCDAMARRDRSFRVPLYEGHIAWADGRREEAMALWEHMCRDYPEEWSMWLSMGSIMARSGRYEEAKGYFRQALEVQEPPRFVDALESIAAACERQGDFSGAAAALEEELALLAGEWDTTAGESVDKVRREIARLRAAR